MPFHRPRHDLPIDPSFSDEIKYVESLLRFVTSSNLFQTLCGGVHVLDFLLKDTTLYSTVIPQEWSMWFEKYTIYEILDVLMHKDLTVVESLCCQQKENLASLRENEAHDQVLPPLTLLEYVQAIRKHALVRSYPADGSESDASIGIAKIPRHVAVGMKEKKIHEVQHFSRYIDELCDHMKSTGTWNIDQIMDFGSGQNYLGRTIASPPYSRSVIALESKQLNIDGAKAMDITAKLVAKPKSIRNRKQAAPVKAVATPFVSDLQDCIPVLTPEPVCNIDQIPTAGDTVDGDRPTGPIRYVQTIINDGNLSKILPEQNGSNWISKEVSEYMVVSLHSCGNLLHHGLRSLILTPAVKAVAMVGCCYNLVTERLGPPTYKIPFLRTANHRLEKTGSSYDRHGFPMSERLATYEHQQGQGIRLNITARMMAVQAPQNWTRDGCESFFTRHFYRALLQRMFLDRGLIPPPTNDTVPTEPNETVDSSTGGVAGGTPIIIGSLRKSCYTSFHAYVYGAIEKLHKTGDGNGQRIAEGMRDVTDTEISEYELRYGESRKELSIVWSLMAFSASVVEAMIVIDRWLWLREQPQVRDCWVQTVFEYEQSPRNLVIVGIKKDEEDGPDG